MSSDDKRKPGPGWIFICTIFFGNIGPSLPGRDEAARYLHLSAAVIPARESAAYGSTDGSVTDTLSFSLSLLASGFVGIDQERLKHIRAEAAGLPFEMNFLALTFSREVRRGGVTLLA